MRSIRRAAVTGLFAMWLAPLPAPADAAAGQGCCNGRQPRAEAALVERARTEAEDESTTSRED